MSNSEELFDTADNLDIEEEEERVVVETIEEEDVEEPKELLHQLPLSKVKRIAKFDSESNIITKEALVLTAVAAELFVAQIAQQAVKITQNSRKKTLSFQHLKTALKEIPAFDFLEGSIVTHPDI